MQARRSHSHTLRRVAFTAALAALLLPAGAAEAKKKKAPKKPVVTSVKPMQANIGDTITIYGRNFIKGKSKNTVAFRRDGAKTVFVKGDVATLRQIRVVLPETLAPFLQDGSFTKFRLRVLARRFGKSFTPLAKSPRVGPSLAKPGAGAPGAPGTPGNPVVQVPTGNDDCDEDKILNKDDVDDDNDLLDDALEKTLMTDACAQDSDGDGVEDGYEYKSAVDLNDDEYQQPNTALPYPGKRPYPNPLFSDATGDFDHDGLKLAIEYELWKYTYGPAAQTAQRTLFPLSYSDGLQYSVHGMCKASDNPAGSPCGAGDANRRYPTLQVANYERWFGPKGFYTWLKANGYEYVRLGWDPANFEPGEDFHILDVNHSGTLSDGGHTTTLAGVPNYPDSEGPQYPGSELYPFSSGGQFLADHERDEDADGLSNIDELRGRLSRGYWDQCYTTEAVFKPEPGQEERPLSPFDADSDGDTVRDGADDEDHDDIPNVMELSRMRASGFDDTDDGSTPPKVPEGMPAPTPTVGGGPLCKLDVELPPVGEEGAPKPMWHGPDPAWGRVHPFNPCLPDVGSRSCPTGAEFGSVPAPLDESPIHHQWYSLQ